MVPKGPMKGELEVLVKFDEAKCMLCWFVHHGQTHVTAQLLVRKLGKVLRIEDGGLRTNSPIPITVKEAQVLRVPSHQTLDAGKTVPVICCLATFNAGRVTRHERPNIGRKKQGARLRSSDTC